MTTLYLKSYHHPDGQWIALKRRVIVDLGLASKLTKTGTRQNGATVYINKQSSDWSKLQAALTKHEVETIHKVKIYDRVSLIGRYAPYTRGVA
jgi:hypothetical protein